MDLYTERQRFVGDSYAGDSRYSREQIKVPSNSYGQEEEESTNPKFCTISV